MITRTRPTLILDDGSFFVVLAAHQPADSAVGFLERRCAVSVDAPNGLECLGAFTRDAGGGWTARISSEFDAATGCEHQVVATGVARLDAVTALWQSRRSARSARIARQPRQAPR